MCNIVYVKDIREILEKNYRALGFPSCYDGDFRRCLKTVEKIENPVADKYDCEEPDIRKNLLAALYMCRELKEKYSRYKIPEEVLNETLKDIVIMADICADRMGELGIWDINWILNHLNMRLFKLGRLSFRMGESGFDIPEKELSKGDKVLEIHIPGTEPLTPESVDDSIKRAKEFFNKYYPGYEYKCFTCHSWLLDSTLEKILGTTSNILNFRKRFDIVREDSDDGIFRQLFKWNTTREKLRNEVPPNSFAGKVKEYALQGEEFHITLGILKD